MSDQPEIKHVVVLMMENRSFDHLLGHLNLDGANLPENPQDNFVTTPTQGDVRCPTYEYPDGGERASWDKPDVDLPPFPDVRNDPGHSHAQIAVQVQSADDDLSLAKATMTGFARAHHNKVAGKHPNAPVDEVLDETKKIMGWHPSHHVPVLSQLATEYTVCNRWFCSVPGETWPNRMFAHQGHSSDHVNNEYDSYASEDSIFDLLTEQKVEWAIYAGDIPQAAVHVGFKDVFFRKRLVWFGEFYDDIRDGTLPAYSFLEPRHFVSINSQHPCHDVGLGDNLIREVYEALASNRDIWNHLLFIITWDEHGGFYDHVPPIKATPPFAGHEAIDATRVDGSTMTYKFDTTGVRVPTVVISPWSQKQPPSEVDFDHTSIIKTTLEAVGNVPANLDERLGARAANAASVLPLLTGQPGPPVPLAPAPNEQLTLAVMASAQSDISMTSLDELDSLQESLLVLKSRLDEARHIRNIMPPTEAEAPVDAVSRLVREFQATHVAPRGTRRAEVLRNNLNPA